MKYAFCTLLSFSFFLACNDPSGVRTVTDSSTQRNSNGAGSKIVVNQKPPSGTFDQSPMDMIYFPVDFPKLKSQQKQPYLPKARVIYSRPQRHDRVVFGELQKYGQPWRMGANEATEIQFFSDATVNGKKIGKGTYTLYCIPEEKSWTFVFNSAVYTWGLQFDKSKDVARTTVPVEILHEPEEVLTMEFEERGGTAELVVEWDVVRARLPMTF